MWASELCEGDNESDSLLLSIDEMVILHNDALVFSTIVFSNLANIDPRMASTTPLLIWVPIVIFPQVESDVPKRISCNFWSRHRRTHAHFNLSPSSYSLTEASAANDLQ